MGPTGDAVNVIQIHPTLRCNLRCRHCYSTSGPEHRAELDPAGIESMLADAAREGFNAVGFSGGEPLVYKPLARVLQAARASGYVTTVTTNGTLLEERRLAPLAPHLSLLAISIDGVPDSHDHLRAAKGSFERMRAGLDTVRALGLPFGFIFTLTMSNLPELEWVAGFALEQGARLLQIHPLESVGRAQESGLHPPDDLELSFAFLEVARLQAQLAGRLTLQFDVADRTLIAREPSRAFAAPMSESAEAIAAMPLASLVSPLVVQEDGWIVPLQHGFSTALAVGHLDQGAFAEQAARWKRERHGGFRALAREAWDGMRQSPEHLPFTNWYAAITGASRRQGVPLLRRVPRSGDGQEVAIDVA